MSDHLPENIEEIEGFYQNHLNGFDKAPPADLWSKIENALPPVTSEGNFGKADPNNKYIFGAVGIAITIGVVLYLFFAGNKNNPKGIQEEDTVEVEQPVSEEPHIHDKLQNHNIKPKEPVTVNDLSKINDTARPGQKNAFLSKLKDSLNAQSPDQPNITETIQNEHEIERIVNISQKEELDSLKAENKKKTIKDRLLEKSSKSQNELFIKE